MSRNEIIRSIDAVTELTGALGGLDLVAHLPIALVVIDMDGIVRHANPRAEELVGAGEPGELEGRRVWDLIERDDVQAVAAAFEPRPDFATSVIGPVGVRVRTSRGKTAPVKSWVRLVSDGAGFDGYVVTMAPESTTDLVAAAMRGIAAGDDLGTTLTALAEAARAFPLDGMGVILTAVDGQIADVYGSWPFGADRAVRQADSPWFGVATGSDIGGQWLVDDLPALVARAARSQGYAAVWVEPIDVDGKRQGAYVVWRESNQPAFVPQLTSLHEAVSAAVMAHVQHTNRHELQQAALEDHLTGVGNRARLQARLRLAAPQPCGVMFIDLDFFKQVNDLHGHPTGDRVLRLAAERLTRLVRPQDAVYRVGGDEFVVVCGPSGDAAAARHLVERMARFVVQAIGEPFDVEGIAVEIGASVGVAVADADTSLDVALDLADDALLAAKRAGRGRWLAAARPG